MNKRTNTAVWIEKEKRWRIRVSKNGDRRPFYSSNPTRNGQREANAKADAWLDDNIDAAGAKVEALFDKWLAELKLTTSQGYWKPYDSIWRTWVRPAIGNKKIADVNEQMLKDIVLDAFVNGKGRGGTGLSKKSLKNIRDCMAAFIKYARVSGMTALRVENVKVPKTARKGKKSTLQPRDIKLLFTVRTATWDGTQHRRREDCCFET